MIDHAVTVPPIRAVYVEQVREATMGRPAFWRYAFKRRDGVWKIGALAEWTFSDARNHIIAMNSDLHYQPVRTVAKLRDAV